MKIEITDKDGVTRTQTFSKTQVVVGRSKTSDMVVPDRALSKRHARVASLDGSLIIVDLDSANGTWVNGERISKPVPLQSGDKIEVGYCKMRVSQSDPASEPVARDEEPDWQQQPTFTGNVMTPGPTYDGPPTIALLLENREGLSFEVAYAQSEVSIGSEQGNDVFIDSGGIAPRHTKLVHRNGKLIVVDLKSERGTWVNGRRLHAPTLVRLKDKIRVGDHVLTVTGGAEPPGAAPTRPLGPQPPPPPKPLRRGKRGGPGSIREFLCNDSLWVDLEALAERLDRSPDSVIASALEKYLAGFD